jgi:hypothetical protein
LGYVPSPPSDTTVLHAYLLERDVQARSPGHDDLEMIREQGNLFDQLLDEDTTLIRGCLQPHRLDVELREYCRDGLELGSDVVPLSNLRLPSASLRRAPSAFAEWRMFTRRIDVH